VLAATSDPRLTDRLTTRGRTLILGTLLALAAACWWLLHRQAAVMSHVDAMPGMSRAPLTMGMTAPLFMAMWVAMMVAMMFPTAAPMIVTFAAVQSGRRARGRATVPTWLFVAAYLAVWTALGVLAYALAAGAERLATRHAWPVDDVARLGGSVLVLAGLYQLSPLKHACLGKCRTPLQFILGSWRDGTVGAVRMGLAHGVDCLGCCWLLFVILFPLGIMNVVAMALVTALIFAEKSLAVGPQIARAAGALLVTYGILVVVAPHLLPTAVR
jgi:predicted metal-binding membrane protein